MDGFGLEEWPDQQGAEEIGQGLSVGAALAADRLSEACDQAIALEAFGQFGVGEGERFAQRVGNRGVGTRAAGTLLFSAGTGGTFDFLGAGHRGWVD